MDSEIKFGKAFLERLVQQILNDHSSQDLRNVTIILPSKRAGVFVKSYFSKLSNSKALWIPRIITIDDFVKENTTSKIIDSVDLLFEFYSVYFEIEQQKSEPFDKFVKWAPTLLSDFNEIDRYLLDASNVFNDLRNIKEIESWSFEKEELTDLQQDFLTFWNKLKLYYNLLNKTLDSKGSVTKGNAYRLFANQVIEKVDDFEPKSIYFAGFNALSNSEQQIIHFLTMSEKAQIFWDADEFYVNNPKHEAGLFMRRHIDRIGKNEFKWLSKRINFESKKIKIVATSNKTDQSKYIGEVLESIPKDEISNTAIVLADETLLMPVLNSIPTFIDSVNVTMGVSLKYTSLYGLIMSIIDIQDNYRKFAKDRIYYKTFLKIIEHPLMKKMVSNHQLIKTQIISKNIVFLNQSFIDKKEGLKLFSSIFKEWNTPQDGLRVIADFIDQIRLHVANEVDFPKLELESVFAFSQVISKLERLILNHSFVNQVETIKKLLSQLAGSESVSFVGEPLSGLQVMGVLETRTLDFKNLIIISANEGNLPKAKMEFSFLPFDVKLQYKLPTYKEKDAIFAHHFYRLIHHSSNIWVTYSEVSDEFGSGEKSRFVIQLEQELSDNFNQISHENYGFSNGIPDEELSVTKSDEIIEKIDALVESGLSPSALNTYLQCPLDFYYKYVIGVREEEEVEESIEASTLGNIMHEVLEDLYTPYLNEILTTDILKLFEAKVERLVEEKYNKYDIDFSKGSNYLMYHATKLNIKKFLKQEIKELAKGELIVSGLEEKIESEIILKIKGEEKSIKFRGTIDRVDSINGETRIMDYKSGIVEKNDISLKGDFEKLKEKSKAFQLLLYSLMYNQNTNQEKFKAGIFSLKKINQGAIYFNLDKEDLIESALLDDYKEVLSEIIEEIYDKNIPFTHKSDALYCLFCE